VAQQLPEWLRGVPEWKRNLLQPIERAVYAGAVGLTDEEVRKLVEQTLTRARRHLSS